MGNTLIANPNEPIEIVALTVKGVFVGEYPSLNDAAFKLNLFTPNICYCLSGKVVSTGGFIFFKKENYNPNIKTTRASILRKRKFLNPVSK